MNKDILLSIIVSTYNRKHLISRALDSVLKEITKDMEVVVVDDGSTDGTPEFVEQNYGERVRLLPLGWNHGRGISPMPARIEGARAASGEWVVMLDSDDELVPGGLQVIRDYACDADAGIGVINFMAVNQHGRMHSHIFGESECVRANHADVILKNKAKGEFLKVARRHIFAAFRHEEGILSPNGYYWLIAAKQADYLYVRRVVRLYHFENAPGKKTLSSSSLAPQRATAYAAGCEKILAEHNEVFKTCPSRRSYLLANIAQFHALGGQRIQAVKFILKSLAHPTRYVFVHNVKTILYAIAGQRLFYALHRPAKKACQSHDDAGTPSTR